jgi:hypothetical protein
MPIFLYLLPVMFLALGAVLFVFGQIQQRRAKIVESWPKIPGVVLSSDMNQHHSTDNDGMTAYLLIVGAVFAVVGMGLFVAFNLI